MMQIHTTDKPLNITNLQVYKAYMAVKSNAGAAGLDGQTIELAEKPLQALESNEFGEPLVRVVISRQVFERTTPPLYMSSSISFSPAARSMRPRRLD